MENYYDTCLFTAKMHAYIICSKFRIFEKVKKFKPLKNLRIFHENPKNFILHI